MLFAILETTRTLPLLIAADWTESPVITEMVAPFLLLGTLISIVTAALKKDRPLPMLGEFAKLLFVLILGFTLFCVSLWLLGDPNAPYRG